MQFYSKYYENNESILDSPNSYKDIFNNNQLPGYSDIILKNYENAISFLLFQSLNKRNNQINKSLIESYDIEQLKLKLLNPKQQSDDKINLMFEFIFNTIKKNKPYYFEKSLNEILNVPFLSLFEKSSKIYSKLLFPNDDDDPSIDIPEDLFGFDEMEDFYSNSPKYLQIIDIVGIIINKSIQNNLNNKQIIRIIEIGSGTGTTSNVILSSINEIYNKLNYNNSRNENNIDNTLLEVEFTYSDVNPILIKNAKKKLKHYNNNLNLKVIFRNLNIERSLLDQGLNENHYDIVVIENVLHFLNDIEFTLQQVNRILKVNGHFILCEPPYRSVVLDSVYGCLDYWWNNYGSYRIDRCILPQENWLQLLSEFNFNDFIYTSNLESLPYLIQCRKHSNLNSISNELNNNDQIILIGDDNNNYLINIINNNNNNNNNNNMVEIINIKQQDIYKFNDIKLKDNSIIFFNLINHLNLNQLDQIINNYNYINQIILNHDSNSNIKHIIVSTYSTKECNHYLNSSIISLMNHWLNKYNNLKLFNFDFDFKSLNHLNTFLNCFNNLNYNQLIIRNHQIYHELYRREFNFNLKGLKDLNYNSNNNNNNNNGIIDLGQLKNKNLLLLFNNQSCNIDKYLLNQLINLNNLSIQNNINLNNIIIQTHSNCNSNNETEYIQLNCLNSILESISNYRRFNNLNSIYINYQFKSQSSNSNSNILTTIASPDESSILNLNLNLYNFNSLNDLDYINKIKLNYYLNIKYSSSNIKTQIIDIINKVFYCNQIIDYNKTLHENFNISTTTTSSSFKYKEFKDRVDNEILKDSIDIDNLKYQSINSIINTIYKNQLKLFEFFRKKTK